METGEFLRRVAKRAALTDAGQVEQAVRVVFEALRAELPDTIVDDVLHQLPKGLRDAWETELEHVVKSLEGSRTTGVDEFLAQVQESANCSSKDEARLITRAVFATLREQLALRPDVQEAIEARLPADMRALWQRSSPQAVVEARAP